MRRYELDWLRVIVFGLLIIYHVGMFFVPWGWHIKNNIIYEWLTYPMRFINHWRLPILFVISGMGTAYAFSKRTGKQFATERVIRLLIPLIAGIILIVPPQVYIERLNLGQFSGSYFEFWPEYAFSGVYPEGNFSWHHLWFLPYLLFFSLVLIPAFIYIRNHPNIGLIKITAKILSLPLGSYLLIIPLFIYEALLKPLFPSTHAFWGDWYNLVNYITLFFYGFLFIQVKEIFWKTISENRYKYLFAGVLAFILFIILISLSTSSTYLRVAIAFIRVFNAWSWMMTLFGFAAIYLNRKSKGLAYANKAVYPFYILHQTVTVIIGYHIMNLALGLAYKFTILTIGTFGITWLLYEFLIRRLTWLHPLFGIKPITNESKKHPLRTKIKTN